jgi:hypothetical protein
MPNFSGKGVCRVAMGEKFTVESVEVRMHHSIPLAKNATFTPLPPTAVFADARL